MLNVPSYVAMVGIETSLAPPPRLSHCAKTQGKYEQYIKRELSPTLYQF